MKSNKGEPGYGPSWLYSINTLEFQIQDDQVPKPSSANEPTKLNPYELTDYHSGVVSRSNWFYGAVELFQRNGW
jgi:hypothetical protein